MSGCSDTAEGKSRRWCPPTSPIRPPRTHSDPRIPPQPVTLKLHDDSEAWIQRFWLKQPTFRVVFEMCHNESWCCFKDFFPLKLLLFWKVDEKKHNLKKVFPLHFYYLKPLPYHIWWKRIRNSAAWLNLVKWFFKKAKKKSRGLLFYSQ